MKITSLKLYTRVLLVALVMAIGMFLVWYSTRWGAGLISDTFQYVASARNFAAGRGFSLPYGDGELQPMTKYPPMFPIVLSMFELAGGSALQGARFINIFLFGVNIVLVFISVRQLTSSYSFSLLASLLFSISFVLIEVHSWALSESLYICLGLCTFLAIARYFKESNRAWLVAGAFLAACVLLTRYVGLSLIVAVIIVIFLSNLNLGRKLADALLFGFMAVWPVALWTLRSYLFSATLNDRVIQFHPLTKKNYTSALDAIFGWFLPRPLVEGNEKLLLILSGALVLGVLVYLLRAYKARWSALANNLVRNNEIVALHVLYLLTYGAMIIVSKTWVDADIGLSDRILSPMLVSLLILFVSLLSFLWNNVEKTRIAVALIALGMIAYYSAGTVTTVQRFHQGGIGISRRGWNRSEAVQTLRSYSSFSIYTNSNSSLYLWSDRAGYNIKDFELLKEKGTDKKVLLVIFRNLPPNGERRKRLIDGLDLIQEDQIVSIYAFGSEQ
jgi:4-amino-4-deoxy-L-arabinose transferase-like glycosyltransferase